MYIGLVVHFFDMGDSVRDFIYNTATFIALSAHIAYMSVLLLIKIVWDFIKIK